MPSATTPGQRLDPAQRGAGPSSQVALRTGQAPPFRHRPARLGSYQTVDASALQAPSAVGSVHPTLAIPAGTKVQATIKGQLVDGVMTGFDYKGRAVITDQAGQRRVASFADVVVTGPKTGQGASVMAALPAGAVVKPPARLLAALEAALDLKVTGDHTAREYTDAFKARGFEVFVVGGGVRDAIGLLQKNPGATDAELLDVLNDVDIVTTAPPPVAREICEAVAPELPGGAVWSPKFVEQFGVVLAGGKKAGLPQSDGLDICAMKHSGMFGDQVHHGDTGEKSFPTTFGHDLLRDAQGRDFCCNALYYDPNHQVVVDPTLQGIADAEQSILHPVRDASKGEESTVSPRFWKFRLRGFTSDGESLKDIRKHAQQVFDTSTGRGRWQLQNALGRTAPKDAITEAAVEAWLAQLRQVMHEDHCADIFDRAIRGGVRQGVIKEVLKRTTKGMTPPPPTPTTTTTTTATTATTGPGGNP